MSNGPIEPSADMRHMASTLRQAYLALIQEGFTKQEAMEIVGIAIRGRDGGGS